MSHLGPVTAHLDHLSTPTPSSLSGSHGGPGRGEVPLASSSVTVAATLPYCPSEQVHETFSELKPFSSQGFRKETILEVTKLLGVIFPRTLFNVIWKPTVYNGPYLYMAKHENYSNPWGKSH